MNAVTVIPGRLNRAYNLTPGTVIKISDAPVKNWMNSENRVVTSMAIEEDGSVYITFTGAPVDVTGEQTCVYTVGQPSGQTDSLPYHTGRFENNFASPFVYRGMENLWGNVWTQTAGLIVKDLNYYFTSDPALYTAPLEKWNRISFSIPEQKDYPFHQDRGWIQGFGFDMGFPLLMLPDQIGPDSTCVNDKVYSFYTSTSEGNPLPEGMEYICLNGGGWDHMDRNGPFTLRFWGSRQNGNVSWLYGSRMVLRGKTAGIG